ncbi:MAG: hypothetical protein EBU52_03630, partial [Cytophagia bacterium]|nr:hypothetical protein [Cytophagia bacterium]
MVLGISKNTFAQTYFYYNNTFNIIGPVNVCADGQTSYTYSGVISDLTWTVSGGTIIGSNVGQSITVQWNSASGTLSATGQEQECWYEPDIWPPTMYCNVNSYSSNAFNVYNNLAFYYLGSGSYCSGGNGVNLLLGGSQTGVNYQLKINGTASGSPLAGTGGNLTWSNQTVAGNYLVTATRSANGCTQNMGGGTVTINPLPSIYSISGGGSYCSGGTGLNVTLNGSQTGVNYQLKINGSNSGSPVAGTGNPLTWSNQTTAGSYTIVASNVATNCMQNMSGSVAISVNPLPTVYSVGGGGSYCNIGSVTLSGSQVGVNYQLRINGTASGAPLAGTGSMLTWSNVTTNGTYSVIATQVSTGCTVNMTNGATVTVNPLPASYTIGGGGAYCSGGGGVGVILSGSQTGINYQLKINGSNTGSPMAGNGNQLAWNNQTAAGFYTVLATNTLTGCTQTMSGSASVSTHVLPTAYSVGGSGTYCNVGTVTLSASQAGINYQLKINGNNIGGAIAGTGGSLSWSNLSASGNYSITATSVSTGCTQSMSGNANLSIDPLSVAGTISCSEENLETFSGKLTATVVTGNITHWQINTGSGWTNLETTSAILNYNNPSYTSALYRTVVKSGTCSPAYSTTAKIERTVIAYSNTISLSAEPNTSYQWYKSGNLLSGATQQTYGATDAAVYTTKQGSITTGAFFVQHAFNNQVYPVNAVNTINILKPGVQSPTYNLFTLLPNEISQVVRYDDGLGRTIQTVAVNQSAIAKDIVVATGYGRQGMIDTTYLPYVSPANNGLFRNNALKGIDNNYNSGEQYQFYQGTSKVASDNYPFARTLFRNTPDAKVVEQGAPGADGQPGSNHTMRNITAWNNATYQVRWWKPNGTTTANYSNNTVIVSITTDENGNQIRTYTNTLGQTVLKQVQEGASSWLDTYYIYDEFGRLKYELPPKALAVLGAGSSLDANNVLVAELIYKYTYDNRNRLIVKKVPGAAEQHFVYDKFDRIVLSQDGTLRAQTPTAKWLYVKYDRYNRVVYTGLYTTADLRASLQTAVNNLDYATTRWYETEELNAAYHGYSNQVFPTGSNTEILTVNYYDHYNFDRSVDNSADYSFVSNHLAGQESSAVLNTRDMATGSKRVTLDINGALTSTWLINVVFYGKYDRPIQTLSNNHLYTTVADISTIMYDFAGKVLKSKTTHYQNAATSVALTDRSEYDHAGRVLKTYRQINTSPEQLLAQYEYNALGQLVDKKLHDVGGGSFLQSVDFRYNIRGWLKSINNAQLTIDATNNDETNDYFGMELLYNTTENGLGNTPFYNGNISALKWKGPGYTAGAADQRSYQYTYD